MKNTVVLIFFLFPIIIYSNNIVQLAEKNNLSAIVSALEKGADINMTDFSGFTALHVAAWNGYEDIVLYLLQQGANPNIISKAGNSSVAFAPQHIKELLFQYGAIDSEEYKANLPRLLYSPNIYVVGQQSQSVRDYTSGVQVVSNVVTNIVSNIITNISNYVSNTQIIFDYPKKSYVLLTNLSVEESVAFHQWDINGDNSIHKAASKGNLKRIKALVEKGINPKSKNTRGDTALRFAAENNHLEVVKYLLEEIGLDVNATNIDGITALIIATFNNSTEMINYLIQMGANVNQAGQAVVNRRVGRATQESTVSGWTALMAAAQLGYNDAVLALLAGGANINALDSDRWNALLFAVQNGHQETVKLLISYGVNYNIESKDKHTALSLATDNKDREMISILKNVDAIPSSVPLVTYDEYTIDVPEDTVVDENNVSNDSRGDNVEENSP